MRIDLGVLPETFVFGATLTNHTLLSGNNCSRVRKKSAKQRQGKIQEDRRTYRLLDTISPLAASRLVHALPSGVSTRVPFLTKTRKGTGTYQE